MKSTDNIPWNQIDCPSSGLKLIRIDASHPHDFFWGKNTAGDFLLLLQINEHLVDFLKNKTVELRGIKSDQTYHHSTSEYYFLLCLKQKEDADIFHRLCVDLIDRTREINQLEAALQIIDKRLNRWKIFLSRKKKALLSIQEIRGLFGELKFLSKSLDGSTSQHALIEGWRGPLDDPHDFVLGDIAVEIKSIGGSHKDKVRISSENQLNTHLEKLFLKIFFLSEFHDCGKGISLNKLVETVRSKFENIDDRDLFDGRLCDAGYIELKEYDMPCFMVIHEVSYEVVDEFPRITPESLPGMGLTNISYDLNLKMLENYICELPLNWGKQ
jgi:hypothetical protein